MSFFLYLIMSFMTYFLLKWCIIETNHLSNNMLVKTPQQRIQSPWSSLPDSSICHTPIVKWGLSVDLQPFSISWWWKNTKKQRWYVRWLLLAAILVRWRQPVASNMALDLLHWVMPAVSYRRIRHSHQNGQQSWCIFSSLFCLLSPRQPLGQYRESGRLI